MVIRHGARRTKTLASPGSELCVTYPERQLVITTYGLLPRDLEHLGSVKWSTVVLDEAQLVKNPVPYTHLRAHETVLSSYAVFCLKKKKKKIKTSTKHLIVTMSASTHSLSTC